MGFIRTGTIAGALQNQPPWPASPPPYAGLQVPSWAVPQQVQQLPDFLKPDFLKTPTLTGTGSAPVLSPLGLGILAALAGIALGVAASRRMGY